jgi:tetratricopeptide (TPR) repeat protein
VERCWGLGEQGAVEGLLGRTEEAIATLKETIELADTIPDPTTSVEARGRLGQCYLRQGELEQALVVLRDGQRLGVQYGVGAHNATPIRNGLAEAYLLAAERSDGAARDDWLEQARRACRAALKQGKAFRGGLPEAMMLQGRYKWLMDEFAAAQKWWQRSLKLAQEMGQRYDLGIAHLEIGQRLSDHTHLERAKTIFAEIGAEWGLARAREALVRTQAA